MSFVELLNESEFSNSFLGSTQSLSSTSNLNSDFKMFFLILFLILLLLTRTIFLPHQKHMSTKTITFSTIQNEADEKDI